MLIGGTALAVGPCLHVERPVAAGDSNARHSYKTKSIFRFTTNISFANAPETSPRADLKDPCIKKAFDRLVAFS